MRNLFKKGVVLIMTLCLSVALPIISFAYDSKSGLDERNPNAYVNSDGQVILQSDGWQRVEPFFAGYAIVCTSMKLGSESDTFIFDYAIIDESGTAVSTFGMEDSIE